MRYGMCREELFQHLRRSDLALFANGSRLVVVAHSGAAGRLVRSDRFQQALARERRFLDMYLSDDDAALCSDPRGHERDWRAAVDDLGEEYTACLVCGLQRHVTAMYGMLAYRKRKLMTA